MRVIDDRLGSAHFCVTVEPSLTPLGPLAALGSHCGCPKIHTNVTTGLQRQGWVTRCAVCARRIVETESVLSFHTLTSQQEVSQPVGFCSSHGNGSHNTGCDLINFHL